MLIADTTVPEDSPALDGWQNGVELLRDPSHRRNYSPGEWSGFIRQAGLVIDEIDAVGGFVPIELNAWLRKAGCVGDAERSVREMFATDDPAIRETFAIRELPDGDTGFRWLRVVVAARKITDWSSNAGLFTKDVAPHSEASG